MNSTGSGRTAVVSLEDDGQRAADERAIRSADELALDEAAYACAARFFLADSVRARVRVWSKLPPERREQDRRVFQQKGPRCGFDDALEFLDELLAAENPDAVPNPEAARPLSDDERTRAVAFHARLNPHLSADVLRGVLRDFGRDLQARPGEEPRAEQLEERATTLEARAQEPGEEWVRPYARDTRARADRERVRAQQLARTALPVAARGARARESSSPPSSRSTSVRSERGPPRRRRPGAGSADSEDDDEHDDVAGRGPSSAQSGVGR